jgi:hypothetical protein
MKKMTAILAFSTLTMGAAAAYAGMAPATGINGSWHDITYLGNNGGGGGAYSPDNYDRVCIFCHTPHNAQVDPFGLNPLWSHAPTTQSYTPYSWAAPANTTIGFNLADNLIGPSRLCMSCHDGATAVDSHGAAGTANNGGHLMSASGTASYADAVMVGQTNYRYFNQAGLNRTHPIGFLYSDAITARTINATQNELVDVVAAPTTRFIQTVTPATGVQTYNTYTYRNKTVAEALYGGYVTCASCH